MKIKQQKRVAVVNDITGFGRCSAAVAQPILSVMKISCCVLPTAILSAHTGYPSYYFEDFTNRMKAYMDNWKELNVTFDGICTGFLGSKEQIDLVLTFIKEFKGKDTIVIVDPVMGDNGELYPTYAPQMCEEIKKLVACADVIVPNLTEACVLLNIPYPAVTPKLNELKSIAKQLSKKGPRRVIITGLKDGEYIFNFLYEKQKGYSIVKVKKELEDRAGTGDVFTSIVAGSIINGEPLIKSVKKASKFVKKALSYTQKLNTPNPDGLCFEEFLNQLK